MRENWFIRSLLLSVDFIYSKYFSFLEYRKKARTKLFPCSSVVLSNLTRAPIESPKPLCKYNRNKQSYIHMTIHISCSYMYAIYILVYVAGNSNWSLFVHTRSQRRQATKSDAARRPSLTFHRLSRALTNNPLYETATTLKSGRVLMRSTTALHYFAQIVF